MENIQSAEEKKLVFFFFFLMCVHMSVYIEVLFVSDRYFSYFNKFFSFSFGDMTHGSELDERYIYMILSINNLNFYVLFVFVFSNPDKL